MAKVLGLGGLFFKSPDPEKLLAWYAQWLGIGNGKTSIEFQPGIHASQRFRGVQPVPAPTPTTSRRRRARSCSISSSTISTARWPGASGGAQIVGEIEEHEYGRSRGSSTPTATRWSSGNPRTRSVLARRLKSGSTCAGSRPSRSRHVFAVLPCSRGAPAPSRRGRRPKGPESIEHVLVIYAENRSFDNLYGLFPGADGIANATSAQYPQVDHDGKPLPHAAGVERERGRSRVPDDFPNRPFRIDRPPINLPLSVATRDLIHKFYQNQEQIDGGTINRYVEVSDAGGLVMGYYDGSSLPLWKWAHEYTLADHFFMGAFGDSYLNHFWLICACTPDDAEAPAALRAQIDDRGWLKRRRRLTGIRARGPAVFARGDVTPDGYAVTTAQPPYQPSRPPGQRGRSASRGADTAHVAAADHQDDRRHAVGEGCELGMVRGRVVRRAKDGMQDPGSEAQDHLQHREGSPNFVAHHQPFNYFARYAPGTRARRAPQGLRRPGDRHRERATAAGECSTSRRAASTSTPATPTLCRATSTSRSRGAAARQARYGHRP